MSKIRLFIVDTDRDFTDPLQKMLSNHPQIELIGICSSAVNALDLVQREDPNVILFDMILPQMDGITFLRHIHSEKPDAIAICCTAFYSSVSIEAARRFGASYYLYKPVELNSVVSAIVNCYELGCALKKNRGLSEEHKDDASFNLRIRNYLVSLGIPAKLYGCGYITEAVRLAKTDSSLAGNLSKGLYLEIARNLNSTPERIERCIRNAIAVAYQKGILRRHLLSCPTNKEFINYVLNNMDAYI